MTRALALLALLIFAPAQAQAQAQASAPLPDTQGRVSLGSHVETLEDPEGKLELEDVRHPPHAGRFAPANADPPNFGYTRSARWLRFQLPGGAPPGEELLLEIAFPSIDRIEFYVPEAQPGGESRYWGHIAGDTFPWDAREVRHRNHVFRFPAPTASGAHTYYMRAMSLGVLTMPMTLWRPAAFAEHDRSAQLFLGLFYGLALALVLYNLMLLFAVQDRVYLYYVMYAAAFCIYLLSFDGLGFQYLWPKSVWAANHVLALALSLTLMLGAQFSRTFLDTRRIAPRADICMRVIVGCGALLAVFSATGWVLDYGGVLRVISLLGFAGAAVATYAAVRALMLGYRPARYFLLAWAALLVFIAFGALRNFTLVPTNFLTIYGLHIGFALDVLLLSFALGDRINLLRRERATAEAEALAAQRLLLEATRESERELEQRIAERTAELNGVNERLRAEAREREGLMAQLREQEQHLRFMAQHDALTGLPNRLSMQQRLALAMELAKRNRKKLAVMLVDLDDFKFINDTRGHPAGDQALVQLAARLRTSVRGSDTVARYGGDEFVLLAGELDRGEDAAMIAEKVADMIQVPLAIEGGPAQVSCSIGISVFPDDAETGEALIAFADKAMYASKSEKDRRYAYYGAR
ncbi:MAG: diguanylate cyclase [Betaproteobacteria bacterium]|nr:diguanylate cyclase [Betaproteobacteria bacterium]